MTTIAIRLADEEAKRLTELARRSNLTAEELAAARIRAMLEEPDEQFQHALRYVLAKNAELYRRLA
jgi:antitoxin FitA